MVKIEPSLAEGILSFANFTHSGWPLFLGEVFENQGLATPILDTARRKCQPECAFNSFPCCYLQALGQELANGTGD